ncbi:MAG: hypothetical protein QOF33_2725 [Thermomicrobiales bacterium]|nr:hypothetical protein [Thermomicrobiales bacterium]MEA2531723.1 hypothetical protein [Thermomicrobiales bacterium]MEA2584640.1 hypothetical protein [Thermomicrobiales bacterium]
MKTLLDLLNPFRATKSRFERYYSGIIGSGSGYPTADEARRDLRTYDRAAGYALWSR